MGSVRHGGVGGYHGPNNKDRKTRNVVLMSLANETVQKTT